MQQLFGHWTFEFMQNKIPVYILKQLNVSPEFCDAKYMYAFQNWRFHFFHPGK